MAEQAEIDRVRAILVASCDAWIASGKRIAPGAFRGGDNCACALGTLPAFDRHVDEYMAAAANALRISYHATSDIAAGFDWRRLTGVGNWYELGVELRHKYVTGGE